MRILRGPQSAPLEPLLRGTVAIIGYGNQGHAHALNLRDSGVRVIVGSRAGSTGAGRAAEAGFTVGSIAQAAAEAELVILAVADMALPDIYRHQLATGLRSGAILGFLHGLVIRYGLIEPRPDLGIVMVAPKGPGVLLRQMFLQGQGLPCLVAVHQAGQAGESRAESIALAWAAGIGAARAAILMTTFADETETDLFGEQAVLCGGMSELIIAAFETLVDAGYPPELAYLECCHEVKQIADLVYQRGLAGMRHAISGTAEFGSHHAGRRVIDERVRARLRQLLAEIRDQTFINVLRADAACGFAQLAAHRQRAASHSIEDAGRTVRSFMPWLSDQGS